jgi:glycosyltransferase involved in cell wall biosynthesis
MSNTPAGAPRSARVTCRIEERQAVSARVLINALSARQRGGQTYLKNVLAFLPRDGSVEVLLLAPASLELGFEHPCIRRQAAPRGLDNPFARAAWERVVLPRIARAFQANVVFFPGGLVSGAPAGCRTVTMFRNMIPFDLEQRRKYPLGYDRFRNWLLHRLMLRSMLGADLVIFISEYARRVVERHAGGKPISHVVIPHGIAEQFRNASNAGRSRHAPAGPYLLYVSYIDRYKAQLEVVQAFALLKTRRARPEKLLLVGPENAPYGDIVRAEIRKQNLEHEVVVTGAIPYSDLPDLYRGAAVNIFASESENCPNILLEALATGRPIVCSDRDPMPEFAGDAVLYFDPAKPDDLASKLAVVLDDDRARDALAERALERSRRYDWGRAAAATWHAIARVATIGGCRSQTG